MEDVIVPISVGVAATAFVWILCAIVVRVIAKVRRERQEETVEKINRILEAAFKGAKLLDEEESLQYVKSVEDLTNKNMSILGTDFLIILDKYLQLLRNYIKEVKAAPSKPSEKAKEKITEEPQELKQNVKPQTKIEIDSKQEIKLEIPQAKIKTETNDEIKKEDKSQIIIETDNIRQQPAAADRIAIKVERKLMDGLFPAPEIKIIKHENDKNYEERASEKTNYSMNATQEFEMIDIPKESAKK